MVFLLTMVRDHPGLPCELSVFITCGSAATSGELENSAPPVCTSNFYSLGAAVGCWIWQPGITGSWTWSISGSVHVCCSLPMSQKVFLWPEAVGFGVQSHCLFETYGLWMNWSSIAPDVLQRPEPLSHLPASSCSWHLLRLPGQLPLCPWARACCAWAVSLLWARWSWRSITIRHCFNEHWMFHYWACLQVAQQRPCMYVPLAPSNLVTHQGLEFSTPLASPLT